MDFDLIVIGSGSVGSSAGYYAAKSGLKVLMLDNNVPPHNSGSHHGYNRIVRCAYGEGVKYLPMILRARELWKDLNVITNKNIFEKCGVLNMGPKTSTFIANARISAETHDLEIDNLTAEDIRKRWDGLNPPDDFIGVFEADAGFIRSESAIEAYVRLSKELGATQIFGSIVKSIKTSENSVTVETDKGTFKGRKALVSMGTWVKDLLPTLPVTPLRKTFTWHKSDPCYENVPGCVFEFEGSSFYSFPGDSSGFKIGKHHGGQVVSTRDEITPFGSHDDDEIENSDAVRQFFPKVGELLAGKVCSYDMSPDDDFIIDTLPGSDNVLIVTGLSGHGFKFTSVLGEIAATFANDKKPDYDLTPFALKRFE